MKKFLLAQFSLIGFAFRESLKILDIQRALTWCIYIRNAKVENVLKNGFRKFFDFSIFLFSLF